MNIHQLLFRPVHTEEDLFYIKEHMFPVFDIMDISPRINVIPTFLKDEAYFKLYYRKVTCSCTDGKQIFIKRGRIGCDMVGDLAHEYGHICTVFGLYGNRSNIVSETSAYRFERCFVKEFNRIYSLDLRLRLAFSFFEIFNISMPHAIAFSLSRIPLGNLIKSEYRTRN